MRYKCNPKYRRLDALFKQVILSERPNRCEWCMQTKPCDLAHLLPKGKYRKMRYDPTNVILLCRYCHDKFHSSPVDACTFIAKYKGVDYFDNLRLKDRMISRLPDLKILAEYFRKELEALK